MIRARDAMKISGKSRVSPKPTVNSPSPPKKKSLHRRFINWILGRTS